MSKHAAKKRLRGGRAKPAASPRSRVKDGYVGCYDSIMSTDGIDRYGGLPYDLRCWANRLYQVPSDDILGGTPDDADAKSP